MLKKIVPFKTILGQAARLSGTESVPTVKSGLTKQLVIEELKEREIIKVKGEEAVPFLQGLITNDMNHLLDTHISADRSPTMYAMFLNKAGRMLYDTIIYRSREPSTFLIECDKNISSELRKHLRLYRVRRRIEIESMHETYKPWVIFDPKLGAIDNIIANSLGSNEMYAADPRVRGLGLRILTGPERRMEDVKRTFAVPNKVDVLPSTAEENYRYHRYQFGVGEGVVELTPGKCFPLEINGDFLHGISFQKGCYIGQELTARVFHTGVVRKRLMPVKLTAVSEKASNVQTDTGANVGTLRGVCNDRALALLRVEQVLKASKLLVDGELCYVERPQWWPAELPNKSSLSEKL